MESRDRRHLFVLIPVHLLVLPEGFCVRYFSYSTNDLSFTDMLAMNASMVGRTEAELKPKVKKVIQLAKGRDRCSPKRKYCNRQQYSGPNVIRID